MRRFLRIVTALTIGGGDNGGGGGGIPAMAAVITDPQSSARNVIRPTGDFIPLTLQASVGQTQPLLEWTDSSGNVLGTINPDGGARFGIFSSNFNTFFAVAAFVTDLSGSIFGVRGNSQAAPASDSSATFTGSNFRQVSTGTANFTGTLQGGLFEGSHQGSGTATTVTGGQFTANKVSTGPVTTAIGMLARITNQNATGTLATGDSIRVQTPQATGAVTACRGLHIQSQGAANVTTAVGILVDNQTGAGTNIAMQIGTGNIGVNGSAPVAKQAGASAAGIAAIIDPNAAAAILALQTALAAYGWVTSPA